MIASLRSKRPLVRESAAEALGKIDDPRCVEPLITACEDSNVLVRLAAVQALRSIYKNDDLDERIKDKIREQVPAAAEDRLSDAAQV